MDYTFFKPITICVLMLMIPIKITYRFSVLVDSGLEDVAIFICLQIYLASFGERG